MNWRKTIYIRGVLNSDQIPHDKALDIMALLKMSFMEHEKDDKFKAIINDLNLVRKTEDLAHVVENLYKWAEEEMFWLG